MLLAGSDGTISSAICPGKCLLWTTAYYRDGIEQASSCIINIVFITITHH